MIGQSAQHKILSLYKQWKRSGLIFCSLLGLAISLPAMAILYFMLGWSLWTTVPVIMIGASTSFLLFPYWRIKPMDTARYLDRQLPELEESCSLLLRREEELGPLEKLQVVRTEKQLAIITTPHPLRKRLLWAAGVLLLSVVFTYGIARWSQYRARQADNFRQRAHNLAAIPTNTAAEKILPGIRSADILIAPPAYTGHAERRQSRFNLQAEEAALVTWELKASDSVHSLQLIFNDSVRINLHPTDIDHTEWIATVPALHPAFYQLSVDGRLSELYSFEVVKDQPPAITILSPKPYTVVDYGEPTKIALSVRLRDDYGIGDATIVATVSSGSGEAVKFKEQTLRFGENFTSALPAYDLRRAIDLEALGLRPGDELYFYCRAKDNNGQESRTDMYIISLPDTAQLMSLQGLTMGVDVRPEYFRSERQIIIETEQLLKEKDTISLQAFHDRSNDLGIDQKLLRLRYGKFLGEEAEEGEANAGSGTGSAAGSADSGKSGSPAATDPKSAGDIHKPDNALRANDFGDLNTIRDAYTDKHDNAEDATYFEPAVKMQLKATLSEMWKAELQLRTYQPRQALPFAYKALRLLKDLQQRSRAYVAKTGVRVAPLDPAKRLAGNLEGIAPPVQHLIPARDPLPSAEVMLRITLGLLEHYRSASTADPDDSSNSSQLDILGDGSLEILQGAIRRLGREASSRPAEFLDGYQAMRRIMGEAIGTGSHSPTPKDILSAQSAIRKLLPDVEPTPSIHPSPGDGVLSELYFQQINMPSGKP